MSDEQEIWVRAWCAVANSSSAQTHQTATNWADQCLSAFRERFRLPSTLGSDAFRCVPHGWLSNLPCPECQKP